MCIIYVLIVVSVKFYLYCATTIENVKKKFKYQGIIPYIHTQLL